MVCEQQQKHPEVRIKIRRAVSNLGMEDPVTEARSKKTETRDDGELAVSNCAKEETKTMEGQGGGGGEEEEEEELDFEDLMMTMSQRSARTRSTSGNHSSIGNNSSLSRASSSALLAMSTSASNFSGSFSTAPEKDQQMSFRHWNDSFEESLPEEPTCEVSPKKRGGRRLPPRTGSGYVRTGSRRDVPGSILNKSDHGVSVSAAAFREKRRSRQQSV